MRRKVFTIIGIVIVSLVVFVIAIFVTFPTDSVRHLIEKKLEQVLKQKQSVEIDSLSISPLLNVTAKGFTMTPRQTSNTSSLSLEGNTYDGYYCAPAVEEQPFIIDRIFVNPAVFSTIKKKPAGKFELYMQDGLIEGEVKSQKKIIEVTAKGKDISLNEFALLSNYTKMQFYGMLEFDIQRAVLENNNLAELNADMHASNTALCPKRLKLDMEGIPYFDLPFTVFGNIEANISVDHDKLVINKLTNDGPDLVFDIKGDVTLKSTKNPVSRLNIEAVITPSKQWVEDNEYIKVIYRLCEKHEDGSIHLKLTGTTKRPKRECGTPIPEPVEEVTPPPAKETKPDNKAEEDKKNTKDSSKNTKEDKKDDNNKDADKKTDDNNKEEEKNGARDERPRPRDRGERSGVFEAPKFDGEPPKRPDTGRERNGRPGSGRTRPMPPGMEERLNRDLDADAAADDENRRLRRQNLPDMRRKQFQDNE